MRTPIRYRWVIEPVDTRVARATRATNGSGGSWTPPVDVMETDMAYTIEMDLPGVTPESVELTFEQGELVIAGERPAVGAEPLRRERPFGSFRRVIQLTDGVAPDRIQATSAHGVLRIEVPKAETARPRRIPVTVPEAVAG